MPIQKIEQQIISSAKSEADAIVAEAKAAAKKRPAAAREREELRFKKATAETKAALQQRRESELIAARAANKVKLLAQQAEIFNGAIDAGLKQFIGDRGGDYKRWLEGQLDSIADKSGVIIAAQDDRAALSALLAEMKKAGRGTDLSIGDETLAVIGGFSLRTEEIDYDMTLDSQLKALKERLLPELAKKTFQG